MAQVQGKTAQKLSREQAAILTAATGRLVGHFSDFHAFAEELMGRPVWTHEFGNAETAAEIEEKALPYLIDIMPEASEENENKGSQ